MVSSATRPRAWASWSRPAKRDKGRALNQQQVLWRHGGVLILSDCGLPAFLPGQQGISGPLIESQTQSVFARFMAVHTGGALARAVDVIPGLAILDISQVAITLVYRYQSRLDVPIDAGNPVADNGKVEGYRNYFESLFWLLHMGIANAPLCNWCTAIPRLILSGLSQLRNGGKPWQLILQLLVPL